MYYRMVVSEQVTTIADNPIGSIDIHFLFIPTNYKLHNASSPLHKIIRQYNVVTVSLLLMLLLLFKAIIETRRF